MAATVDDRALVLVVDKLEAGETLRECQHQWILWGNTGVPEKKALLWEAIGRMVGEVEDALGVKAPACHEGSADQERVRRTFCEPGPVIVDLRGDGWQQNIAGVVAEVRA